MTSPPKINPSLQPLRACGAPTPAFAGAFTLLEIVIVLAVSGLIIGGAITTVILSSDERALRNASGEIELLAKKARTASILHQTPYAIEFHPDFIRILPFAEATAQERTTALGRSIGGEKVSVSSRPVLREKLDLDPEILLSIRHWNTSGFITPTEMRVPVWRFDPDGLSEPLTVRLTIDNSYAQDTYHPLTASISDSELEAR